MAKDKKQPIRSGVAKVPMVMQLEASECGAAALTMILAYFGKWVSSEQVRSDCGVSRDGSNASNIMKAARRYGLQAKAYRMKPSELRTEGVFPCIVHWNGNHFVVLNGFRGGKAYLNDPARGSCAVSMEAFERSFSGVCLQFEPGETFVPGGKRKSVVAFARERLRGAAAAAGFTVLLTIIVSLLGILRPAFSRVFLDRLLTGRNPEWFVPFLAAFTLLAAIEFVVAFLQASLSLKIRGKMETHGSASYLWKVLHLPMEFFSQRMTGDIQQRQKSNASIAYTLVNTFAPLVLDAGMLVFYLVVMIRYSWILTLVGVASVLINLFVSRILSKRRVNITRVQMRDAGLLAGATVSGIERIESVKATGAENGYFERWAGYQAGVNAQAVKYARLNHYLGMVPALVSGIDGILVMAIGVWLTIGGSFTVGMILAFQGFLNSFSRPAMTLISAGQTLQEMRTEMERIEDVMRYPADASEDAELPSECGKLSGKIEMKDVTFGYARIAPPLIEHFDLTLEAGARVAIVGASGCGKSTIANLISGLYRPWSGEILFDGKPKEQIDRAVFTGSLAVVDQDIILFEDTIANNIRMWDDSIEDFAVILAARDAQLHGDIMQREGGYRYRITEGGKDFSGGQRQRILIARAIAAKPKLLLLDEATSSLDNLTQKRVADALASLSCTRLVVAHRLSTIRRCDRILFLEDGRIAEEGTFDALIARGGRFAALMERQRQAADESTKSSGSSEP